MLRVGFQTRVDCFGDTVMLFQKERNRTCISKPEEIEITGEAMIQAAELQFHTETYLEAASIRT